MLSRSEASLAFGMRDASLRLWAPLSMTQPGTNTRSPALRIATNHSLKLLHNGIHCGAYTYNIALRPRQASSWLIERRVREDSITVRGELRAAMQVRLLNKTFGGAVEIPVRWRSVWHDTDCQSS